MLTGTMLMCTAGLTFALAAPASADAPTASPTSLGALPVSATPSPSVSAPAPATPGLQVPAGNAGHPATAGRNPTAWQIGGLGGAGVLLIGAGAASMTRRRGPRA
jgi:hypothetical protein